MSFNGQEQWSPGWAHTSPGWSNTPDQQYTGQQVDGMEDIVDELSSMSIGNQQVYNQNLAYQTQTFQLPAYQSLQHQPYSNPLYQSQPVPNQQYQTALFPSPTYPTSTYSNPTLHEQYVNQAGFSQTYSTGNYTHRSQPSYSGDQLQSHAGPASQDRTSTFIDKGKLSELGTRSRNRGPGDRVRDRVNGRSKTHGRGNSSKFEKAQPEADNDDPFYEPGEDSQITTEGRTRTSSHANEESAIEQFTLHSAESAANSSELRLSSGFNADALHPDYPYEDANSQQTLLAMNVSTRAGHLLPLGLSSGAIDHSILANRPISGPLDPRYKIHPSAKFNPGSVFKILWPEPAGANLNELSGELERVIQDPSHLFYSSIRRYIVVGNDEGNCTCVPILTYLRRGCSKAGVKPRQHGIAYHAGSQPQLLEGEPQMGFKPIQIEMVDSPTETLTIESRVNYSKLMTIEHNYKVFFIGRVTPEDFQEIVIPAVDTCWNAKNRGTTSDHHRHISRGSIER
ncbi:hypothetical protein QBC45DRAFT_93465 [Copromyces sp. CBS 386.78]|nr:hypothetical protein QBC45DRAFT_93465 [Copromyces sp. CBS 386.78]